MNVVYLPALASTLPAFADGALCLEGPCLLSWAWSTVALTLLSAWVVRRWQSGNDIAARLAPSVLATSAIVPQVVGIVSQSRQSTARPKAELAASGVALRAPPTTDMAARPVLQPAAGFSFPSPRPTRSTGTPALLEPSSVPGQYPPA